MSIFHYQYENGRRYHAYRHGGYVLPNDDMEQERLDLQHHIWRLLLQGSLYLAPLAAYREQHGTGTRILDLGCGTGIWAIDIADEFEDAVVLGVDLSPIQPEWVPPNCRFYVDDFEDEWTYGEDERIDYIHGRAMLGSSSDWPALYKKCLDNLKPGGLLEIQEYDAWIFSDDDSCQRAKWTTEWMTKLDEASNKFGKMLNVAKYHKQWIIDAGFVDVKEVVVRVSAAFAVRNGWQTASDIPTDAPPQQIPIGPWTKDERLKELGRYERIHMQMSVASHTPALLTRVLGYTAQQASVLIEGVRREFRSNDLRLITAYRFITARKPEAAT